MAVRMYPDPVFIEDTIKAFPNKSVANAEEARVSPAAASLASPRSVCRRL